MGAANDPLEREAETMAERVVAMEAPGMAGADIAPGGAAPAADAQRAAAGDPAGSEEPETLALGPEDHQDPEAPPPEDGSADGLAAAVGGSAQPARKDGAIVGSEGGAAPADVARRVARPGSGRPLPEPVRAFMEPRFGRDFSSVRIHDGPEDRGAAHRIGARAFTHGHDIWFGPGESAGDRKLLAHELTHVVQQTSPGPARQAGEPGDPAGIASARGKVRAELRRLSAGTSDGQVVAHPFVHGLPGLVQRACGEQQIGSLDVDATGIVKELGDTGVTGPSIRFKVGCDEFLTPGESAVLQGIATQLGPRNRIVIHGFASEEGPAQFNEMLSVARAVKVRDILSGLINPARIERTVWHGAVPGNRRDKRSVIIEVTAPLPPQHRSLAIVSWINGAGLPNFSRANLVATWLTMPPGSVEALGACMALKCTSNTRPPDTFPEAGWPTFIGSKQYRAFQTFKIEHYPASDLADTINTAQHVGYTAPSTCGPIPPDTFVQGEPSPLNHVDRMWTPKDTTAESLMKIRVSTPEETAAVDAAMSFPNSMLLSRSWITHVPWVWSQTKLRVDRQTGAISWRVRASRFPTNTIYLDGKKVGELPQGGCNVVINQRFRNIDKPRQSLDEEKKQGSVKIDKQDETVHESATASGAD